MRTFWIIVAKLNLRRVIVSENNYSLEILKQVVQYITLTSNTEVQDLQTLIAKTLFANIEVQY